MFIGLPMYKKLIIIIIIIIIIIMMMMMIIIIIVKEHCVTHTKLSGIVPLENWRKCVAVHTWK